MVYKLNKININFQAYIKLFLEVILQVFKISSHLKFKSINMQATAVDWQLNRCLSHKCSLDQANLPILIHLDTYQ